MGGSEMIRAATIRPLRTVDSAPGGWRLPQDNGLMRITPISR
jgi:hypothetical protein